jgi:hypothetical protein
MTNKPTSEKRKRKLKGRLCWLCGSEDNLTVHHLKCENKTKEKREELEKEISSLSKANLSLLDDLKKKFEWDEDLLKEWYEEYWHTYSNQNEQKRNNRNA